MQVPTYLIIFQTFYIKFFDELIHFVIRYYLIEIFEFIFMETSENPLKNFKNKNELFQVNFLSPIPTIYFTTYIRFSCTISFQFRVIKLETRKKSFTITLADNSCSVSAGKQRQFWNFFLLFRCQHSSQLRVIHSALCIVQQQGWYEIEKVFHNLSFLILIILQNSKFSKVLIMNNSTPLKYSNYEKIPQTKKRKFIMKYCMHKIVFVRLNVFPTQIKKGR